MIIKAFKAARRAVGRVVTKEIEDIKNARSWREFIRSAQRHRYRKFARPHPTAMMTVFEPVHLLVFNEMIEMHGGKLKAERMIYIAPDKIESVQPYSKHDDQDEHSIITIQGIERIVFGHHEVLIEMLEIGVDIREATEWVA
jgi:hypothetical protein